MSFPDFSKHPLELELGFPNNLVAENSRLAREPDIFAKLRRLNLILSMGAQPPEDKREGIGPDRIELYPGEFRSAAEQEMLDASRPSAVRDADISE